MDTDKKIISFDFDETLNLEWVQNNLFLPLSKIYHPIILTSRTTTRENKSVWALADALGIDKEEVFFTNYKCKSQWVDKLGSIMHFDDDVMMVHNINEQCKCKGILIGYMMDTYEFKRKEV